MRRADDTSPRLGEQNRPAIGRGYTDGERALACDNGVGTWALFSLPGLLGDRDLRRVDLVGRQEAVRLDPDRRRHTGTIRGDMIGPVVRTDAAIEAGIVAAGNAAVAREKRVPDAGNRECLGLDHHDGFSNPGSGPSLGICDCYRFEEFPHTAGAASGQPPQRKLYIGCLLARRHRLQRRRSLVDAQIEEESTLRDRPVNARADRFCALRQRLEIDVGGQIGSARGAQRIGESMSNDRLQCFPQATAGMAIVDDQSCTLRPQASTELERHDIGTPFVDRTVRSLPQATRQRGVKERQRIGRGADDKVAVGRDIDDALVPAVRLFDGLMNWQRIDELVGDDDTGAAGDLLERRVPERRHVERFQPLLLNLPQCWTDLDQMQHDGGAKSTDHFGRPQGVDHQRAAAGSKLDHAHILRRAHLLPDRGHPESNELAEHLADFRCGDEVAADAKRIARDVIAVLRMREAKPHVVGNGHRPGGVDQSANFALQGGALISHL